MKTLLTNETRSFYKMAFSLVMPMALQNLINVGISSIDVLMLGKVSEAALSGAALAGQVQFIMVLIFFGLTSGAAVLTAQYWGKGDTKSIEKIMGICMRFSLIISILFTTAVLIFPRQIMTIFTFDESVIDEGVKYLHIIAFSYILISITMIYLNLMRSVERVIISTVIYMVSLVSNVIIASVLIFGLFGMPEMGIRGAAIATLSSRIIEVLIVIIYSVKYNKVLHFKPSLLFVRDKYLFKDFLVYSIPVMLNELMWGAGIAMNSVVIGHLGKSVVSANSVAQVARQLAMVIAFGLANATAISVGKAIGENNLEIARDYSRRFIRLSLLAGIGGSILVLIARPITIALLDLAPHTKDYLSTMMFIMAYYVIAQALTTTLVVGVFRAGGDTRFGLYLDVSTMWGGSILFGALAAFIFKWSVPVVYIILMSDEIIKLVPTFLRYRSKKWLNNVTR